jgi:integrase
MLPRGLYKRGSVFYSDFQDSDGKRFRRSLGTDLEQALVLLDRLRAENQVQDVEVPPAKKPARFAALTASYLKRQEVYSKPRSAQMAGFICKRLAEHFASFPLSLDGVDAFIAKRKKQGVSPRTINADLTILRAVLNHAVAMGLLEKLPLKVKLLKAPRKRELPVLSREQIRTLLSHTKGRYYGIILVASTTGFRADEILNLQWKDIYFEEGRIAVTAKKDWSPKSHQSRSSYVPPSVMQWLAQYRASRLNYFKEETDYVFSARGGGKMMLTNLNREIRKVFKRAGLYRKGVTLHWLRHSCASHLLANGVDLETVRVQLGHASLATTALYLHSTDEKRRAVTQLLEVA